MASIDLRYIIQSALAAFKSGSLSQNSITLFNALGYNTTRQQPFEQKTWAYFKEYYVSDNFNSEIAKVSQWQSIDLLFQLSIDEVSDQQTLFGTHQVEQTIMESYLFFSLELKSTAYSRTELAQITREINKVFSMPAMILFKHGDNITLSVINRRLHKTNAQKDVLEKVTLIKDIAIENTHRAHIDILSDLSFTEIRRVYKVSNFVELHNAWQKTLDTKQLNKKFYKELSQWYFWAITKVYFPSSTAEEQAGGIFAQDDKVKEHNAKNLIRLLTRILFVWFIKEKDLIPDELFDETYIREHLITDFSPKKDENISRQKQHSKYYRAILQNLFFATLNQTAGKREFRNDKQHRNVTQLMRYENYFKDPQVFLKLVEDKVPFMNGGLFECLDRPDPHLKGRQGGDVILYEDGFSDRPDNLLRVPDYIFFDGDQHADLSVELGDKKQKDVPVKGLINILKAYKFTVTENTPIEEDIALDPELLGQVFENLLASYNPETKTTARKQTGSFYTPREIVDYMVDESLIAYLGSVESGGQALPDSGEACTPTIDKLRALLSYNDLPNPFNEIETTQLITAIDTCKILDPACGSGAFPMGILHKLVHILHKLDPQNQRWQERQLEKARLIDDVAIRDQLLEDIEAAFNNNELDYGRKLYLIENCIYGVDIQPIATQISKLRFFISLIVDQKSDRSKDNFGIRPLPNLEAKFVAANTLIGIEAAKTGDTLGSPFDNPNIKVLEEQLKEVRHRLFSAKTPATKRKLREEDRALREQIAELLQENGCSDQTAQQLASWNPYDQNIGSPFFDSEWMFGLSEGFDVVIGNPPYIFARDSQEKGLSTENKSYFYTNFELAEYQLNLYPIFIEQGYRFLKEEGLLSYITPNNWLTINTNKKLRAFVLAQSDIKIVNFYAQVFESAAVDSAILVFKKGSTNPSVSLWEYTDSFKLIKKLTSSYFLTQKDFLINIEAFKNKESMGLIEKIESCAVPLDSIADVKSGLKAYEIGKGNPVQTLDIKKNRIYHSNEKIDESYLKYLDGKNVCRYYLGWGGEFLKYGENLAARRNNFNLFISKRILVRQIPSKSPYCINACLTEEIALNDLNSMNIINFKESPEFILAVLNSKLISYWFVHKFGKMQRGTFPQFKVNELASFPILKISAEQQQPFIKLVDYILFIKKQPFYQSTDLAYAEERLMANFFENLINALVYELYFPDELHETGKYFISLIEKENLPDLNTIQGDKLSVLKQITQRLTDKDHPLYVNLFFLDSVSIVRVIEGKE